MLLVRDHPPIACSTVTVGSSASTVKNNTFINLVLNVDSKLYLEVGQFTVPLLDICAWRMAVYASLRGRKEGGQLLVLWLKTAADNSYINSTGLCYFFQQMRYLQSHSHQLEGEECHLHSLITGEEGTQNHEVGIFRNKSWDWQRWDTKDIYWFASCSPTSS